MKTNHLIVAFFLYFVSSALLFSQQPLIINNFYEEMARTLKDTAISSKVYFFDVYIGGLDRKYFKVDKGDTLVKVTQFSIKEDVKSMMRDSLVFDNVDFTGTLFFPQNFRFNKFTGITYSKIPEYFNCRYCDFKGDFNFSGSVVGNLILTGSIFHNSVLIEGAEIGPRITLSLFESIQDISANFIYSSFNSDVSFDNSIFKGLLTFNGAIFKSIPTFRGTFFPDSVDFRRVRFDLIKGDGPLSVIDLRNVNIDKHNSSGISEKSIIFIGESDPSKYLIPFSKFRLGWVKESIDQKIVIYEGLINTCKKFGMYDSARNWDVELQSLQLNDQWPNIGSLLISFNRNWWNFGYEKWRILCVWLPLLFIGFYFINLLSIENI